MGGFRRAGRERGLCAQAPKPAADPGWGEPLGRGRSFPGPPEIIGEAPGQPKLGMRDDDQPGPAVSGGGIAELRDGPAQGLLEQPEGVFQVEPAQERLPAAIDLGWGGAGLGPPQPQRFRVLPAGELVDLQPDHGALHDRQLPGVVGPGALVGQPRMQPIPPVGQRGAVTDGVGRGRHPRWRPLVRAGQSERGTVPWRASTPPGDGRSRGETQHPVRTDPAQHLDRQVSEQERQPAHVIAGVEHEQDVRVTVVVLPGRAQPPDQPADLGGGHVGQVCVRADPHRVEHRGPRRAPGLQRGDDRVGPAGDHLRPTPTTAVGVAEQPLRAGRGVRAQPRTHVHSEHDPPVPGAGQRQPGQRAAQPGHLDPAVVERVVQRAVPAAVLRAPAPTRPGCGPGPRCTAPRRSARTAHPPARSSSRRTRPGTRQDHPAEPRPCPGPTPALRHTVHHGHRLPSSSSVRGTRRGSSGGRAMSRRHAGEQAKDTQRPWQRLNVKLSVLTGT